MTTEQGVSTESTVLAERQDGVLLITLNRPNRLNALTDEMRGQLRDILRDARAAASVRAVVLTGAGRAFCSGAELSARPVEPDGTPASRPPARLPRYGWLQDFSTLPVPVVAAVNGVAAGAGLGLALACDIRVVAPDAYFYSAFAHRALAADNGVSWTMTRLVGPAKTLRWLWNADRISADLALQSGLADVVPTEASALDEALRIAQGWANGPTVALGTIKQQVYHALESTFADQLVFEELTTARVSQTADVKEGAAAFREKREPQFKGQ
ncbi:MAG: enoyl-CoA hydratase/isomerase family protein [Dehalococcoidia bacterium]